MWYWVARVIMECGRASAGGWNVDIDRKLDHRVTFGLVARLVSGWYTMYEIGFSVNIVLVHGSNFLLNHMYMVYRGIGWSNIGIVWHTRVAVNSHPLAGEQRSNKQYFRHSTILVTYSNTYLYTNEHKIKECGRDMCDMWVDGKPLLLQTMNHSTRIWTTRRWASRWLVHFVHVLIDRFVSPRFNAVAPTASMYKCVDYFI